MVKFGPLVASIHSFLFYNHLLRCVYTRCLHVRFPLLRCIFEELTVVGWWGGWSKCKNACVNSICKRALNSFQRKKYFQRLKFKEKLNIKNMNLTDSRGSFKYQIYKLLIILISLLLNLNKYSDKSYQFFEYLKLYKR